jgi:plasmid stabilization system protein ParE
VKPILVRPAAAADIEDTFLWYQTQRLGLGDDFREALRFALIQIAENPQRYPVIHRGTRRALLKRFPYGVFYREFPQAIIVVACMHGRRNPKRWQSRI